MTTRAGTSPRTITRLEKGDPGVAIGTLTDVLVTLGLIERLADLIDLRKDELELELVLVAERQPKRGQSFATALRRQRARDVTDTTDVVDPMARRSDV